MFGVSFRFVPRPFVSCLFLTLVAGIAFAEPKLAPLPKVVPALPGEVQPQALGEKQAAPLPRITLQPSVPGVLKIEYASNGFIEVAHALVILNSNETAPGPALLKAQLIAKLVFEARPKLSEVDLSLYRAKEYRGLGGPPPYFTASVPKDTLAAFEAIPPDNALNYPRLWFEVAANGLSRSPNYELEKKLQYEGPTNELRFEQLEQTLSQHFGSSKGTSLFHGDPSKPLAALTFDDSPHPLFTPLLLDLLKRAGVRATFFCIGRNALAYPYFVQDMVRAGHELANHTFHHVRLSGLSAAEINDEILRTNLVLESLSAQHMRYFRPPGGRYSRQVLKAANALGLRVAFWTDDPGDFNNLGTATLEAKLLLHLRPGGIVLLHDNVLQTIQVLLSFIKISETKGIQLGTLSALEATLAGR